MAVLTELVKYIREMVTAQWTSSSGSNHVQPRCEPDLATMLGRATWTVTARSTLLQKPYFRCRDHRQKVLRLAKNVLNNPPPRNSLFGNEFIGTHEVGCTVKTDAASPKGVNEPFFGASN